MTLKYKKKLAKTNIPTIEDRIFNQFIESEMSALIDSVNDFKYEYGEPENIRLLDTEGLKEFGPSELIFEPVSSSLLDDIINQDDVYTYDYYPVYESITSDESLVKIEEPMSLRSVIEMSMALHEESPDKFYGVLVEHESDYFNPLHPLIANALMLNGFDLETQVKAIFYSSNFERNVNEVSVDKYKDNFISIIAALNLSSEDILATPKNIDIKHLEPVGEGDNGEYSVEFDCLDENGTVIYYEDNIKSYIVPNQILNKEILIPYYGVSYIVGGSRAKGASLTPNMLSGNIATENTTFSSVCTGSRNSDKYGYRGLNHVNQNSAYNNDLIGEDYWNHLISAIRLSIEIYLGDTNLNDIEPPVNRMEFDEWSLKYNSTDIKDYLEFLMKNKQQEIKNGE